MNKETVVVIDTHDPRVHLNHGLNMFFLAANGQMTMTECVITWLINIQAPFQCYWIKQFIDEMLALLSYGVIELVETK